MFSACILCTKTPDVADFKVTLLWSFIPIFLYTEHVQSRKCQLIKSQWVAFAADLPPGDAYRTAF